MRLQYVCPRSSNRVVRAIECNRACRAATPGEILVVSDNRHDLRIRIGNGEDHRVGAGIQYITAAIGGGSIVLRNDVCHSEDDRLEERSLYRECYCLDSSFSVQ